MRARMSVVPAGGYGTIHLIGRLGYSCAAAKPDPSSVTARPTAIKQTKCTRDFMAFLSAREPAASIRCAGHRLSLRSRLRRGSGCGQAVRLYGHPSRVELVRLNISLCQLPGHLLPRQCSKMIRVLHYGSASEHVLDGPYQLAVDADHFAFGRQR